MSNVCPPASTAQCVGKQWCCEPEAGAKYGGEREREMDREIERDNIQNTKFCWKVHLGLPPPKFYFCQRPPVMKNCFFRNLLPHTHLLGGKVQKKAVFLVPPVAALFVFQKIFSTAQIPPQVLLGPDPPFYVDENGVFWMPSRRERERARYSHLPLVPKLKDTGNNCTS